MPRHQQVTTCRRNGGPVSKFCSCEHCNLSVCSVCGAGEGSLTTDCPGQKVDFDKQQEVYETDLDYTDERGWHLAAKNLGDKTHGPRFENTEMPVSPPRPDPRATVAPMIDWAAVDRTANLQHELAKKAIAWVLADRICDDHTASLDRVQDEANLAGFLRGKADLDDQGRELLGRLEQAKISFKKACRRAEQYDEEFRQAARLLVATLEEKSTVA